MNELLTEETPGKVIGLLGASLLSLAFLFTVSYSNASFQGTRASVPNVFAPENVVAMIDVTANSYSSFLNQNLIQPAHSDLASIADLTGWTLNNAQDGLAMSLGLPTHGDGTPIPMPVHGTVAGAYTTRAHQLENESSNVDTLLAGQSAQ